MRLLPVAKDGWRFILPLVVVGGVLVYIGTWAPTVIGSFLLAAAVFTVFFFRDFDRKTPLDESAIYSPGDGKVLGVAQVHDVQDGSYRLVRIFLSVLDGHVQRSPVTGRVTKVDYKKGTFLDARNPNAHLENERNSITLETKHGSLIVTQIAGLIARRIVCWVKRGNKLEQGERYGLIRFGSQVDLHLPMKTKVMVAVGDRVVGGETVIARWMD